MTRLVCILAPMKSQNSYWLKSLKEKEFKDLWIANPFTGESCDSSR